MTKTILITFDPDEFKALLKDTIREILHEQSVGNGPVLPEIMSVQQTAEFLNYKVNTLYEKTCKRTIPHFKKGKKLFFRRSELEEWLKVGKIKTHEEIESEAITHTLINKRK